MQSVQPVVDNCCSDLGHNLHGCAFFYQQDFASSVFVLPRHEELYVCRRKKRRRAARMRPFMHTMTSSPLLCLRPGLPLEFQKHLVPSQQAVLVK